MSIQLNLPESLHISKYKVSVFQYEKEEIDDETYHQASQSSLPTAKQLPST